MIYLGIMGEGPTTVVSIIILAKAAGRLYQMLGMTKEPLGMK